MLKKLLFSLTILISASQVLAQCTETDESKVLLIGDSWAFFMGVDGTIDEVLSRWGHTHYKYLTNPTVAENGAETEDFLQNDKQTEIQNLINNNPSIEVIHLSISGNDVLGDWNINFTQTQLDELIDSVYSRTLAVIDFLKTTKPGIKIVFSGYVYPNFEEVLTTDNPLGNSHPFYGLWDDMGQPTFLQINTILNDFSDIIEAYAATDAQVEFYKAPGLLQYTFGQNDSLGVAPGGVYPPFSQPLPFGDPSYPSPKESMRDYFSITKDCFHLSPKGYRDLIGFHTQKFYHKFFMDDQYLTSSLSNDGSVSSNQNTSADLTLGKNTNEEFATILSFNTATMNFEKVVNAELFLHIENVSGNNPLDTTVQIGVNNGAIGSSLGIENNDFTASVALQESPCVFGTNNNAGRWVRIELPASMNEFITKQNETQFILKSSNTTNGTVRFSDASDSEFAPVLNLKFDSTFTSIKTVHETSSVSLYPNPSRTLIKIANNEENITALKVYDMLGRLCIEQLNNSANLDIKALTPGIYKMQIVMGSKSVLRTFVKE